MSDDRPIRRGDEDRIDGPAAAVPAETGADPRPEGAGWVTAEPPAVADESGRLVTVAGPDSAAADSVDRPEPGAEILPDALPPVDARHARDERVESGSGGAAVHEEAAPSREEDREDGPLSPAEQPTTEAPRLTQARAEGLRAEREAQARSAETGSSPAEPPAATSIHDARPEESSGTRAVSAPAVTPAPPPVPTPTTPVQQTGEQPVAAPPAPVPVYLESPVPPKKKGNRAFGILMSLLATLVFALVWAAAVALIMAVRNGSDPSDGVLRAFTTAAFWIPVVVFLVGMILLALVINRGGWVWWLLGGLLLAALVYGGYVGGTLLSNAGLITAAEVPQFLAPELLSPYAIGSAFAAREVSIWFGLATSARGKKVKARNAETRQTYERESAERRAEYERARAGIADQQQS